MAGNEGVQVLHLSMPRNGSFSMKAAYEELGLPTYHGFVFVERPRDQISWYKAVDAKYYGNGEPYGRDEFDDLLAGWAVVSDNPAIGFVEELLEAYPNAKVVLVDRDVDKWYRSYDEGVIRSFFTWKMWAVVNLIEPLQTAKPVTVMQNLLYAMFECSDEAGWRRNARRVSREHTEKIRNSVPRERLLEYQLGSGGEPLCEFLGKEVPDKPFPHLNDSKEFERWMKNFQTEEVKRGGWDAETGEIPPGLKEEIDQAFENVDLALRTAGGEGWSQVFRVRIYALDEAFAEDGVGRMVENMKKWAPDHAPLLTGIGVSKLGQPGMRVEVEVSAYAPRASETTD
ncbi:hypothetical protein Cob_v005822 [Colletotrichum orbiculare MAFF 240422]|uniref:Uncharacterized protein n=1 Tax=Colletotrichum orbiculare (strain 104-T / ATCC 96160 / CBS 514.97 / LARS 414 / MAFF 240422) TaxID=1213857 RepID=A0A484FTS7_COLOR|nr:hypothetical protein Cob_v005822 [Colletotrichum orbiculare MAFF 240422]